MTVEELPQRYTQHVDYIIDHSQYLIIHNDGTKVAMENINRSEYGLPPIVEPEMKVCAGGLAGGYGSSDYTAVWMGISGIYLAGIVGGS